MSPYQEPDYQLPKDVLWARESLAGTCAFLCKAAIWLNEEMLTYLPIEGKPPLAETSTGKKAASAVGDHVTLLDDTFKACRHLVPKAVTKQLDRAMKNDENSIFAGGPYDLISPLLKNETAKTELYRCMDKLPELAAGIEALATSYVMLREHLSDAISQWPSSPLPQAVLALWDQAFDRLGIATDRFVRWQRRVQEKVDAAAAVNGETAHSDDFTSVNWYSTQYQFTTGLQAESVRLLWEAWENGTPSLSEQTIREKTGSCNDRFRLEHVFKPTNKSTGRREAHPAWGTMIRRVRKGVFALSP
jgi:hypothetical protein